MTVFPYTAGNIIYLQKQRDILQHDTGNQVITWKIHLNTIVFIPGTTLTLNFSLLLVNYRLVKMLTLVLVGRFGSFFLLSACLEKSYSMKLIKQLKMFRLGITAHKRFCSIGWLSVGLKAVVCSRGHPPCEGGYPLFAPPNCKMRGSWKSGRRPFYSAGRVLITPLG